MARTENSLQIGEEPTPAKLARYGYEKPGRKFLKERVDTIRQQGDTELLQEASKLFGSRIATFIARTEGQDRVGP